MSKTIAIDVRMEIKISDDASVEEKERALLFVKCERERSGHYRYYLDAGDTALGFTMGLRYIYTEVCEACGAEITEDNSERECTNRCGDMMCYSCEVYDGMREYICPTCAKDKGV